MEVPGRRLAPQDDGRRGIIPDEIDPPFHFANHSAEDSAASWKIGGIDYTQLWRRGVEWGQGATYQGTNDG